MADDDLLEPYRRLCGGCNRPVLMVPLEAVSGEADEPVIEWLTVELVEWEPRAKCQSCAFTRAAHPDRKISCARCGNSGYVGSERPAGQMVAIDLGWSDDDGNRVHVRLIGERTDRRRGEALHSLHTCARSYSAAILRRVPDEGGAGEQQGRVLDDVRRAAG